MVFGFPGPGEQGVDSVDGMAVGHPREDVVEVSVWLDPIELPVSSSEATTAQRSAPPSDPAKRWFLRPRATGRIARSTGLLSSSMRPSSTNRHSAGQRASA